MVKQRCLRCKTELTRNYRMELLIGPRGYRRYAVCQDACQATPVLAQSNAVKLIATSADDLRSSLLFRTRDDLAELRQALKLTRGGGEKTKAMLIAQRIRKLEKVR